MKTFKQIEISSTELNHEEMKSIKAGYYGGYACSQSSSGNHYSCSSAAPNCMKGNGSFGNCTVTITSSPYSMHCACE